MSLPVTIGSVHYYLIAGQYAFSGELVITRGVIYFFPDRDLEQERMDKKGRKAIWQRTRPDPRTKYLAQLRKNGFWQEGDGEVALQKRLDEHITWLKESQRIEKNFFLTADSLTVCKQRNQKFILIIYGQAFI